MILFQKKVGETPLEMLDRLRSEKPEFKDSKLSYAGRLDPMASGQMIVLVDEENKDYKKYLGYDKKYKATILLGASTDTGDLLGLITKTNSEKLEDIEDLKKKIKEQVSNFTKIKTQKYPWFSSMTVGGLKLFDHFKMGNLNIERPVRNVEIKKIEEINFHMVTKMELEEYVINNISKINGSFRQPETIEKWKDFFNTCPPEFLTVEFYVTVSTGTYIRGLVENIDKPALLWKLHREKIIV